MPALSTTIDATVGGETSNSYVEVDECDSYWEGHWNQVSVAAWQALNSAQKSSLLIQACRVIETVRFVNQNRDLTNGYGFRYNRYMRDVVMYALDPTEVVRYNFFQRLQFPRNIDIYHTTPDVGTIYVPNEVKWAQCEQATYILSFDTTVLSNKLQGIKTDSMSVGGKNGVSTDQDYFSGRGTMISPVALHFLQPFTLKHGKLRRG